MLWRRNCRREGYPILHTTKEAPTKEAPGQSSLVGGGGGRAEGGGSRRGTPGLWGGGGANEAEVNVLEGESAAKGGGVAGRGCVFV